MSQWQPITEPELQELIENQLLECSVEQRVVFEKFKVPFQKAQIRRSGTLEEVFIVAKNGAEAMYYEDVEEGFNFSPISEDGEILEPGWNQDELKYALWYWTQSGS
ncbi:MAG TPA: hypothetical protein VM532_13485 [Burkholderiales bacterium]|nr:hypothetical protein [Burkholderiales bacterium]